MKKQEEWVNQSLQQVYQKQINRKISENILNNTYLCFTKQLIYVKIKNNNLIFDVVRC